MEIEKPEGLIAAPPTPMTDEGELNLGTVERQVGMLVHYDLRGAFPCGTTGESLALTVPERLRVAERWVEAAPEDFAVIVHVGHTSLVAARELAAHAQRTGADAVAAMGPSFLKPDGIEGLVAFCSEVAAAAARLPFYYYHIPSVSGVDLPMIEFLRAAADSIPNLAGMKYTHEDLMDYLRCLRLEGGRYDMLFGRDEMLLAALALGARGAVGTTYNFAAPLYHTVMRAFEGGDMATAREAQAQAAEMVDVLRRYGGVRAAKEMMKLIGLDCGPARLPLRPFTDSERRELRADLEAAGFFDYAMQG
ncbi:MAG: dihydrodipicolinate synthase family protein [Candidatus Brocadiia bacterium]